MLKRQTSILIQALLLEGGLGVVAAGLAWWRQIPLYGASWPTFGQGGLGLLAGGMLLAGNYALIEYGAPYSRFLATLKQLLEHDVAPLFRHFHLPAITLIALSSGVGEEMFFRGVLQAELGLWLASAIFGLAHIWRQAAVWYGLYAAGIGLLFGGLAMWSGSLWVPTIAHCVNNFVAVLYYVYHRQESPLIQERQELGMRRPE